MKTEKRAQYAEYISKLARNALTETGIKQFPKDTILCVQYWSELAELDDLIGWKIHVTNFPSAHDFSIAFNSEHIDNYRLLKAFIDGMDFIEINDEN